MRSCGRCFAKAAAAEPGGCFLGASLILGARMALSEHQLGLSEHQHLLVCGNGLACLSRQLH